MRKWFAALGVAAGLVMAACSPSDTPPPPPINAKPLVEAGAYDQRIDDVTQELRDALEARYGPLEFTAYRIPPPAAWPSINAYYQGALSSWSGEPALPKNIRAAHGRAWKKRGAVFAIALIDKPVPGEDRDYKVLVVATASP
jgi:hypothetical protein